jgi:hypothetical protein
LPFAICHLPCVSSPRRRPRAHVFDDALDAALERLERRRVRDPDEAGGVERLAGRQRDAALVEQRLRQLGGRADAVGRQESDTSAKT